MNEGLQNGARWRRLAWAPAAAAILTGLVYITRVDSVFYFLYGAEGQGILLASALAKGQGFVDLALPGHPPHVREPPLFYLSLAGVIKAFGLRMLPMKVFMWTGYIATAAASVLFFQRRARPWLALLATMLFVLSFELFRFFTGPKSDAPFMALILFAILALEILIERIYKNHEVKEHGRDRPYVVYFCASVAVILCLAAVFTRSLGLALFIAGAGSLLVYRRNRLTLVKRLKWIAVLLLPLIAALSLWSLRTASTEDAAGYDYVDWFLMDLPPDSPEMIAADFHAPLMGEIPRISARGFMYRVGRHSLMYPANVFSMITGAEVSLTGAEGLAGALPVVAVFIVLLLLCVFGAYFSERGRPPLVPLFLAVYFAAVVTWPMDDPRLLFPLLPFAAFYTVYGFYCLTLLFAGKAGRKPVVSRSCAMVTALLCIGLITVHGIRDREYYRLVSSMPLYQMRHGFQVRFMSKARLNSYLLLDWLGKNAERGSVIMYHSPPPCRLVTGHTCSSIPFTTDFSAAHNYIMDNDVDYVVLDEFGKGFPGGPGQFVEKVLRPVYEIYGDDFEPVYTVPRTDSKVLQVKKNRTGG